MVRSRRAGSFDVGLQQIAAVGRRPPGFLREVEQRAASENGGRMLSQQYFESLVKMSC